MFVHHTFFSRITNIWHRCFGARITPLEENKNSLSFALSHYTKIYICLCAREKKNLYCMYFVVFVTFRPPEPTHTVMEHQSI